MPEWFFVEPIDTTWFRTGRPFVAGEDSYDGGLFPPSSWTFQGMIRTQLLRATASSEGINAMGRERIVALVGQADALPAGWSVDGPFPAQVNDGQLEPWLPAPRFLWVTEHGDAHRAEPLPIPEPDDLMAQPLQRGAPSTPSWLGVPFHDAEPHGGWLSAANLDWLVRGVGQWNPQGAERGVLPPFVRTEERFGVAVEDGKALDHMLFVGTHHRMKPRAGLLGRLRGEPSDMLQDGVVTSGKKARLMRFAPADELPSTLSSLLAGAPLPEEVPDKVDVWVSLLTPAHANAGELHPFDPIHAGAARVELLGMLASPGRTIGGFDQVADGGRPVRSTWSAGSSWRFSLVGGSSIERRNVLLSLAALPESRTSDEARFGFGQRIVTLIDPRTNLPIANPGTHHG